MGSASTAAPVLLRPERPGAPARCLAQRALLRRGSDRTDARATRRSPLTARAASTRRARSTTVAYGRRATRASPGMHAGLAIARRASARRRTARAASCAPGPSLAPAIGGGSGRRHRRLAPASALRRWSSGDDDVARRSDAGFQPPAVQFGAPAASAAAATASSAALRRIRPLVCARRGAIIASASSTATPTPARTRASGGERRRAAAGPSGTRQRSARRKEHEPCCTCPGEAALGMHVDAPTSSPDAWRSAASARRQRVQAHRRASPTRPQPESLAPPCTEDGDAVAPARRRRACQ